MVFLRQQGSVPSLSVRKEFRTRSVACGGSGDEVVECGERGKGRGQNGKKYKFITV